MLFLKNEATQLAAHLDLLPRNFAEGTSLPLTLKPTRCVNIVVAIVVSLSLLVCSTRYSIAEDTVVKVGLPVLTPGKGHPFQGLGLPTTLPLQPIFDALTTVDDKGQVQPWLALSWSSDDATTWTFELRDDVTFSNGEVFNAAAVVATLDHIQSPEGQTETVGSTLASMVSAIAVDEFAVKVTLGQPDPLFPLKASMWRIPAPAHFKALGIIPFSADPVGTGPFKVIEWTTNKVRFVAFEDSWRAPKVSGLELIHIPEQTARNQSLAVGAIDIAIGLGPNDAAEIERNGGTLHTRPQSNMTFLAFALETYPDSPLKDARVRQALNYAINRTQIIEVLLGGFPKPISQLAAPSAPGYESSLMPYPYNPERAKELLGEAGYQDGFALTMAGSALGSDDATVYQQIAADLAAINVDLSIQLAPVMQMTLMLFDGKMRGEVFTNPARILDPLGDYRYRSCLGLTGPNQPYFCDREILPVVEQARAAGSLDAMASALNKVLIHEHANPPGIFLWEGLDFDATAASVKSYKVGYDFIHFDAIERKRGDGT